MYQIMYTMSPCSYHYNGFVATDVPRQIMYNFLFLFFFFMAPFYGWGSTASRLEPLRGASLLFTTKFPEIPGTHFTDLGRMKG